LAAARRNDATVELYKAGKRYLSDVRGPPTATTPAFLSLQTLYMQFRNDEGIFLTWKEDLKAVEGDPVAYWRMVAVYAGDAYKPAIDFFIRLVTAHAGQGCAERQNKNTKKHRTVVRNRQSHIVTKAYMEIDSVLRMERAIEEGKATMPYLKAVRLEIDAMLEEEEEEEEEGEEDPLARRVLRGIVREAEHGLAPNEDVFVRGDVDEVEAAEAALQP